MPTKKPVNLYQSVSNAEEAAPAILKPGSQPPSEGTGPAPAAPRKDGTEAVKGFKLTEVTEAETARRLYPPENLALADIGEASFGPPPPHIEDVHGPDDRVRVTPCTAYPWRAIASLLITARDNSMWIGTGWFIGPHTLMTAGHVVCIKNSGVPGRDGWVKSIAVYAGRDGNSYPYGTVVSTTFRSVTGWTNNGDQNYDLGAIIIPNNLGNTVGWFGFGYYTDADLLACTGNISGYPGDKTPAGTQWYAARRIASVAANKVYYDIDTAGGQSGSPVWRVINGARYGIAIHAYGGAKVNSGTRITKPIFDAMVAWAK